MSMKRAWHSWIGLGTLLVLSAGCGERSDPVAANARWREWAGGLTNLQRFAALDVPGARLVSSFDPQGGNDDYNQPLRAGAPGWVVLADLQGPAYISRFWFTGAKAEGTYRLRFFFDGEKTARLDTTLEALCGVREQYCWLTYRPMPFARSLRIEAEANESPNAGPRLFYQVNVCPQSGGAPLTFPAVLDAASQALAATLDRQWKGDAPAPAGAVDMQRATLAPGATAALLDATGPARITELRVRPDWAGAGSAAAGDRLLRDLVLRVRWDGAAADSVVVPLGDFFGSLWHRARFRTLAFGMDGDTFFCRWPMPFRGRARLAIENQGAVPVTVEAGWRVAPGAVPAGDGYFHAGWHRSGPDAVGRPHTIVHAAGRGRYVGCLLSVTSAVGSYCILEGDETISVDGEPAPGWRGTGLEDYFNGGWYYQNPLVRPLHGLLFRAPYRTIQYRQHLNDAVTFGAGLDMTFERGPQQASRGWMESVAFYYLADPQAADSAPGAPADRAAPPDPQAAATLMTELINAERLGDVRGAMDRVAAWLEGTPAGAASDVLRLRLLAYRAAVEGWGTVSGEVATVAAVTNSAAGSQARGLAWWQGAKDRALLGMLSNGRTRLYIDGTAVMEADQPAQFAVRSLVLPAGRHVLAAETQWTRQLAWLQVCLRTHEGDVASSPDWRMSRNAAEGWTRPGFDDSSWERYGKSGTKGPPEEPFVHIEANAWVGMQARAIGIRAADWDQRRDRVYFRTTFVTGAAP